MRHGGNAKFGGTVQLSGFTLDGNTITGVDDSSEFTNDDAHIMTSAAVEDKILGYSYTANALPLAGGTMTGAIDAGTNNVSNVGTLTATTVEATTLDLGDWTVTETSTDLVFAFNGVNKMKLDSSGNLKATGNVSGFEVL